MKKLWIIPIALIYVFNLQAKAQNVENVKRIVKELSSEKYHGRCYTNQGADKAAVFIQTEFEKAGLQPLNNEWFQPFNFKLNQIREVSLAIDGKKLQPGNDYIVRRNSPSINDNWDLLVVKEAHFEDPKEMQKLLQNDLSKSFIVIDYDNLRFNYDEYDSTRTMLFKSDANKFILLQESNLTDYVGYGRRPSERVVINMKKKEFPENGKILKFAIKTDFTEITSKNVIGFLPGSKYKDSIIIVCGHYDHLGEMGSETYFPGADDNASAIGSMIELASYMQTNNYPEKSILFAAFSAEEAGLIGSSYFVEHLPVDKNHINFVINVDMIGFGDAGLQIWNGINQPRLTQKIKDINKDLNLVDTLIINYNTPNSDHYSFTKANIDAIFFTTGVEPSIHYHSVADTYENTPLSKMSEIIQLISKTISTDKQKRLN